MKKDMSLIMKEAHRMTREIKAEFPEVNYKFQLGLCMSYLLNEEGGDEQEQEQEITLEVVEAAVKEAVEDLGMDDWDANTWKKYDKERVYFEVFYYKGGKKRVKKCGYWDILENEYCPVAWGAKCYDVIKKEYV